MWHTPTGDRILAGAEAELIRAAVDDMLDDIRQEKDGYCEDWPYGIEIYDGLPWQQRLALLSLVANALFKVEVPKPRLTAVNEATLGAIIAHLKRNLVIEIDGAYDLDDADDYDRYYWRRRLAACQTPLNSDADHLIPITCDDEDNWDLFIEVLKEDLFWDEDWDMPELFLDAPPELSRKRHKKLNIESDYYTALPPDPSEREIAQLFDGLIRLVRREGL